MKQYCLGHETLVFGASNNIVSSVDIKYSERETLVLHFRNTNSESFTPGSFPETSNLKV